MELVGSHEFAEMAGVSVQAVWNWRTRYEDFPEPVAMLRMGPIWLEKDAIRWIRIHNERRAMCRYD